ncbi:AmmeMemoRadiSam system protein B [Shewanella atlantica]|uniref:MEMO1 family protein EKG39_04050 n=1 Tax=Shewanella atlantica TaxID=271099 RepID=A0A431WH84_9GAMM|nr:AmmeMemoRadiSam system protein B [Shewanella atlantica]RTR34836.1 AmmeMemoRadiSam system protein B [Shewanella atlantica]
MLSSIRQAAVADLFYPADPVELTNQIKQFLCVTNDKSCGQGVKTSDRRRAKALIVPHAGYIYSGAVAGRAFAQILDDNKIETVVLLGPAHRVYLRGCALPEANTFATPLGKIPIEQQNYEELSGLDKVVISDLPHLDEHCLEVQLPFLQLCLQQFRLLPIVVGECSPSVVADILELFGQRENTLIVVSTDLSHYHSYAEACRLDQETCEQISDLSTQLSSHQACGCYALNGLNMYAKRHDLAIEQICYLNSGDSAGDKSKVVGYASFALY